MWTLRASTNCLAKFVSQILLFANFQNNMRKKRYHLQQFGKFYFKKPKKPANETESPAKRTKSPAKRTKTPAKHKEKDSVYICALDRKIC